MVMIASVSVIVSAGFYTFRDASMLDVEVQSGRVSSKKKETVSCEHSYPCHPHPCGKDGEDTCYDTCYEHLWDYDWDVYTTNGESFTIDRIDSQGCEEPPRFTQVRIGEPTASRHFFKNYIKGNPWSLLRREGSLEKFKDKLPKYPWDIYDYYHIDRFVSMTPIPGDEKAAWVNDIAELNAELGKRKQVNVVVLVTPVEDENYYYGLEEAWLGGKKNDLIVILGVKQYPTIEWVKVMSWSRAENLKVAIKDRLLEISDLRQRQEILNILQTEIDQKFVRRPWEDFQYLLAGVKPSFWELILIWVIAVAVTVGLCIYFYNEDPFNSGNMY
jgi:phenylpyruvate tautomerase PptA (4-oxalocrotonate tautomerase family)